MAVSWHLLCTALIVALGSSFQSGYFISLYNVPQDVIEDYINESVHNHWHRRLSPIQISTVWATVASTNQAAKVIACFLAPIMADRIGRKWTLQLASVLSIAGIIMQYLAQPTGAFLLLAAGRFVTGLYNGLVGIVVPLFLVEIAVSPGWRGGVTRIHNVATIVGNILALLFGIPDILGTPSRWGYLALVPLPLVIIETLWLLMIPESPLYLLQRGKSEIEVKKSLRYYLGDSADKVEQSVNAAVQKKKANSDGVPLDWCAAVKEIMRSPILKKGCILWLMLSLASSFAGGAVTNNYLTSMIAGASKFSSFAKYSSVTVSSAKILVVLGALYVIDKMGRRPLLLITMWSVLGCLLVLAGTAFAQTLYSAMDNNTATWTRIVFLFLWTSITYVVNSTATLIVSETAMQKSRALSLSIFKISYHLCSVVLTFAFPPMFQYSPGGSYLLMAGPYLFICIILSLMCPETRHVDLFTQEHSEKIPLLSTETKGTGGKLPSYSQSRKLTPIVSEDEVPRDSDDKGVTYEVTPQ